MRRLLLLPLLLASCATEEPAPAKPASSTVHYLSPTEHLVRAAMALTGTRPGLEELRQVEADPGALPGVIDRLLHTPQFGEAIRDLHNDALFLRSDLELLPHVGVLADRGATLAEVNRSVVEEPLRLIERVVEEDRPYTEIVTADWTMADRNVADVWGVAYDDGAGGWQPTRYEDGRPAAGILSTSTLWLRHPSAGLNYDRGRANLISRALLCFDFLKREVPIDGSIDLSDPRAVAHAVVANQDCASCHQTLDPLASYLLPFRDVVVAQLITDYPIRMYDASRADLWIDTNGRAPAYFGDQGGDLETLGRSIATDPRFSLCAARRFAGHFTGREPEEISFETAAALQRVFVESGWNARALARAIVLSDDFRASHAETDGEAAALPGLVKARPEQLARLFEDLAGFTWRADLPFEIQGGIYGSVDLARSDLFGYRSLAGGIDSEFVTQPSRTMNAASSLFLRAFAAKAAGTVVEADLAQADPSRRRLLTRVDGSTTDEAVIRAQLVDLHLRLFGESVIADSVPVTESWSIFRGTLERTGDARRAWKVLLTAMFQDLRIAYY